MIEQKADNKHRRQSASLLMNNPIDFVRKFSGTAKPDTSRNKITQQRKEVGEEKKRMDGERKDHSV